MTPEQAQTHLMMLRLGQYDAYDRELDRLLEEQDPLSPLVLELAFCMSDRRQTISVLHNFLLDHPADQDAVMEPLVDQLRTCYRGKTMTAAQVAEHLYFLIQVNDYRDPWCGLYEYVYYYELYDEGLLSQSAFERCFESDFLHGVQLDPWALQKEENRKHFPEKIIDFFRS